MESVNAQYHFGITYGTFNRLDDRFCFSGKYTTTGESQCTVIVAWMYHFVYKPNEWKAAHLDNIMVKGSHLHGYAIDLKDNELIKKIKANFKVFSGQQYMCEPLHQLSFFGKFTGFRSKLKKYMEKSDDESRCVLFKCKKVSFGIFGYETQDAIEYCLYDSHGRNSDGFFDYTANSCVLYFKSIDKLCDLLARDQIFAHCCFECVPLRKVLTTSTAMLTITPEIDPVQLLSRSEYIKQILVDLSDDDSYDSDDTDYSNNTRDTDKVTVPQTKSGRAIQSVKRYESAPHPSFYRGKLREDRKRDNRNFERWHAEMTPTKRKIYNERKSLQFQRALSRARFPTQIHYDSKGRELERTNDPNEDDNFMHKFYENMGFKLQRQTYD